MIEPGIFVALTPRSNIALEYGFARRLNGNDAVYAGGMRAYAGTQNFSGHDIGGLLRIAGSWTVSESVSLFLNFEHLVAGDVVERAEMPSDSYGYVGATFRY